MGWTGALLVVITAVFPVLAVVVRRKWWLAGGRRAEVLRLVRLAAAEAERAEREAASFAYVAEEPISAVSSGGMGMQHCAVCYCPTTTRCSRCKAVRYCSGNCQIIHWRRGHKDKCYPPLFDDQHEGQSNALATHLRGEQVEISEISENGSGYTKQSVSNVQGEKIQSSVIGNSRLEFGGKSDDTKCMKESSKTAIPVEANQTAEVHSNIGKLEENHLLNPSGDISATSEGPCSSRPVEIPDDVLSNNDLAEPSPQKHADRSTSEALESNSPTNSYSIPRTSVTDADWINHKNHSEDKTSMASLDYSSSSRSMKVDCQNVDGEEHKLSVPSNMNSSNPSKLMDAMNQETTNKYKPMDSVNIDKSEISQISEICSRSQREIQSVLTEKTKSSNSTESQICDDNHPPELGTVLPSELTVKVSSLKSNSRTAASVRSETEKTTSLVTGKLGEVSSLENNNEHLKSLYSTRLEDSLAHGQSISRNASLSVDKVPSISTKLPNINASSSNVKMPGKIAAQEMTSFSLSRHNQSTAYCGSGKYNYKVLFPYDNFIRLYNSDKVEMLPCGLINCGNSCYANSVFQCLAFTRPLAAFLLDGLHAKACLRKDQCFTCEFESLLAKMKLGRSPISPAGIIFHLKDIGSNFGHGREEDAHEFLRYAIDAMQSACLKEACASSYSDLAPETTIIQLIFGGYLRSKIKCMRCQGKSEHRERMMDLTVDVHGDTGTLEEALARFTATEVLEGENKYKCDRCKSYEQAKKQLTILEAPNVLTIALKRYQYGKYGKLNKMVRFSEYLNLAPYMRSSDDNSPVYRLYAVVVHKNDNNAAFSGHYVCYVKNTRGKWFKADDSMVKEVELRKVLSQSAYMLLYARLLSKEMAKKMKQKECTDERLNSVFSHSGFASPEHRAPNHTTHRTLDPSNFGPHDLFDERFRRPKADSSSDSSSLFSCSDEGSSWSTESSKDSAVSELESTHISLDSPQRFSNELDSTSLGLNGSNKLKRDSGIGEDGFQAFLYSTKEYRNSTEQCSSRWEADLVNPSEVKSGVLLKRYSRARTARTFY